MCVTGLAAKQMCYDVQKLRAIIISCKIILSSLIDTVTSTDRYFYKHVLIVPSFLFVVSPVKCYIVACILLCTSNQLPEIFLFGLQSLKLAVLKLP